MGYNIDFTRFKSSGLAGLDCGSYLKIPRRDDNLSITDVYTGDLEVGQCVAMVRVPAGARIVGADLSWTGASNTVLGVGDPFACGRFLVVQTLVPRGVIPAGHCVGWGVCGTLVKTTAEGDGCGLFYLYTCETDIVITNLYSAAGGNAGGWAGGGIVAGAGQTGSKWTGGRLVLTITYKQGS